MANEPVQFNANQLQPDDPFVLAFRLISDRDVVVANSLTEAARLAVNGIATNTAEVITPYAYWPRLRFYDNAADSLDGPNPQFIWDLPVAPGQTQYFGVASGTLPLRTGESAVVQIVSAVIADNAHATRFELFRRNTQTGLFQLVTPQPAELGTLLVSGTPNNPATGRTENAPPYNWQFVRFHHLIFFLDTPGEYAIAQAIQATNYVNPINSTVNPAGLQFITDITFTLCD